MIWLAPAVIASTLVLLALAALGLRKKYPSDDTPVVDAIDRLLPQTQCAQCGYPGCRPYAEAVANGAATNLCPPGGNDTHRALSSLMGTVSEPPAKSDNLLAVIDEANCIGCTLCLPPCPVDAIVGGPGHMHTVIENECTGCELCIIACPVDCISMISVAMPDALKAPATSSVARACINCGACEPVCPAGLDAHALFNVVCLNDTDLALHLGLDDCIECGLCDRACPSDIDLAQHFATNKLTAGQIRADILARDRFKARFNAHQSRHTQTDAEMSSRRNERLQNKRGWS
jgi:electron transport complex protein RnfB